MPQLLSPCTAMETQCSHKKKKKKKQKKKPAPGASLPGVTSTEQGQQQHVYSRAGGISQEPLASGYVPSAFASLGARHMGLTPALRFSEAVTVSKIELPLFPYGRTVHSHLPKEVGARGCAYMDRGGMSGGRCFLDRLPLEI